MDTASLHPAYVSGQTEKGCTKGDRSKAESRMSLGCRNEATRSFETVGVVFGGVGKGTTADKGKT